MFNYILNILSSKSEMVDWMVYETILALLVMITWFVLISLLFVIFPKFNFKNMMHASVLELFWTIIPLGILFVVGVPAMLYLYFEETLVSPQITVKVLGNQWYWSYFFSNFDFQVDSFMKKFSELKMGDFYFLETTSPCVVPLSTSLEFLISSSDVLHSWAIPSLLMKTDAIPGLSSSITVSALLPGSYFGMCSELCGAFHSYMPINLEVCSQKSFISWCLLN